MWPHIFSRFHCKAVLVVFVTYSESQLLQPTKSCLSVQPSHITHLSWHILYIYPSRTKKSKKLATTSQSSSILMKRRTRKSNQEIANLETACEYFAGTRGCMQPRIYLSIKYGKEGQRFPQTLMRELNSVVDKIIDKICVPVMSDENSATSLTFLMQVLLLQTLLCF